MSFGMDIGAVHRVRSNAGESTGGLAKSARVAKAQEAARTPVAVKVEAVLTEDSTYALQVEADGGTATRTGVEPDDLSDTIARLIVRVSEAYKVARAGDMGKHREEPPFRLGGMSTPVGNKHHIRFHA